jgi:hypothetical protein
LLEEVNFISHPRLAFVKAHTSNRLAPIDSKSEQWQFQDVAFRASVFSLTPSYSLLTSRAGLTGHA